MAGTTKDKHANKGDDRGELWQKHNMLLCDVFAINIRQEPSVSI